MKMVSFDKARLGACIESAQQELVVITRNGRPVALILGVEGMDEEQIRLGTSDKFWRLVKQRRAQRTISRSELEQKINQKRG